MALHPAPTIENHLGLITQRLTHSAMTRAAALTFAVFNNTGLTAQQIVNNFQTHFNTDLKALFDDNVTIQKPFISLGDGSTTPSQAVGAAVTVAGTRAGIVSAPPQVSVIWRKFSTVGGRKNRGRTYIPWILATGDVSEAGVVLAGTLTTIQTATNTFLSHLAGDPNPMVIPNKTLALDGSTGKYFVTAITAGPTVASITVENVIGTQRRRLVRA